MARGLIVLLSVVLVVAIEAGVLPDGSNAILNHNAYFSMWTDFKKTHNKLYETRDEEAARFKIYIENHRQIENHNQEYKAGRQTFELAMNKFGDMSSAEFRKRNGFKRSLKNPNSNSQTSTFFEPNNGTLPTSVDWRDKGYVTHVKDQASCGSCWAFSAVGSLEGQHFRLNKSLVELSEQNLVDCSGKFGNEGCNGGLMDYAFAYIKSNQGIDTETSYPYQARDGRCRFNQANIGATDNGFVDIKEDDEQDLQAAIATIGPISVAIDAGHSSFQFYKSGVYYEKRCSSEDLDHGVLAVGYGVDQDGTKYYIVKNSWGATWGDNGYIRMSRDKDNNCGIASAASYPLV